MATAIASSVCAISARRVSPLALWHLTSLDAPSVAALWTIFFAKVFGAHLPLIAPAALAVAVWMFYVADRVSDARAGEALEERHRFHHRNRTAFAIAWLLCIPVLIALIFELPHGVREGWLALALPLGVYVGLIHGLRLSRVPKEPLVAGFFAFATILPVVVFHVSLRACLGPALFFGAACWMNCAAIARWEHTPVEAMDGVTRWLARRLRTWAGVLLVSGLLFSRANTAVGLAVACSAVCFLLLDKRRTQLGEVTIRALADASLLTPVLVWPILALFRCR